MRSQPCKRAREELSKQRTENSTGYKKGNYDAITNNFPLSFIFSCGCYFVISSSISSALVKSHFIQYQSTNGSMWPFWMLNTNQMILGLSKRWQLGGVKGMWVWFLKLFHYFASTWQSSMNFTICILVSILILKLASDKQYPVKNSFLQGLLHEGKANLMRPFILAVLCPIWKNKSTNDSATSEQFLNNPQWILFITNLSLGSLFLK